MTFFKKVFGKDKTAEKQAPMAEEANDYCCIVQLDRSRPWELKDPNKLQDRVMTELQRSTDPAKGLNKYITYFKGQKSLIDLINTLKVPFSDPLAKEFGIDHGNNGYALYVVTVNINPAIIKATPIEITNSDFNGGRLPRDKNYQGQAINLEMPSIEATLQQQRQGMIAMAQQRNNLLSKLPGDVLREVVQYAKPDIKNAIRIKSISSIEGPSPAFSDPKSMKLIANYATPAPASVQPEIKPRR